MNTDLKKAIETARQLVFDTPDGTVEAITLENGRVVVVLRDGVYNYAYEPKDIVAWASSLAVEGKHRAEQYQALCDTTDPIEDRRVARELAEIHDVIVYDGSCDRMYDPDMPGCRENFYEALFMDELVSDSDAVEKGVSLIWLLGDGWVIGGGWMNDDEDAFADAIAEELAFGGNPDMARDRDTIESQIERVPYLTDEERAERA